MGLVSFFIEIVVIFKILLLDIGDLVFILLGKGVFIDFLLGFIVN